MELADISVIYGPSLMWKLTVYSTLQSHYVVMLVLYNVCVLS